MLNVRSFFLVYPVLIAVLLLVSGWTMAPGLRDASVMTYAIEPGSRLFLEGSSNINQFTCECNEQLKQRTFEVTLPGGEQTVHFQQTRLELPASLLDCGHKVMNKDLQKALKADKYPFIIIDIKEARLEAGYQLVSQSGGNWIRARALAHLTIADVTQPVWLEIRAQRLSPTQYHFISAHTLNMSDFDIDPPAPFFGMIKVHDAITINMDLKVTVKPA